MLVPLIFDAKDKHPTFIFSVLRSRMLAPFIFDAKDKHPTFIFSVIKGAIMFFFLGGGAWVRRIYEKLWLDSPRVANLGRCHAYLGCRNMLLRDFHLPLFVTDKWVKCYCELILGLASLVYWWYGDVPLWRPPFSDPDFRSLDPVTKHLRSHAYQNSRVVARDCSRDANRPGFAVFCYGRMTIVRYYGS